MSVSNWKEREKKQRRSDILDVAESLFFVKGYDNVSMSSIAKKIGLGKATLYIYFNNKEEIFYEIVLRGVNILNNMIKEKAEKEDKGLEKLDAFKKTYGKFIQTYPEYFQAYNYLKSGRFNLNDKLNSDYHEILMQSMAYIDNSYSFLNVNETIKKIFKVRGDILSTLHKSIELCIKEGTIQSDVDPLKITAIQILICENLSNLPFDFRIMIEDQGVDYVKFTKDFDDFISHLYIK